MRRGTVEQKLKKTESEIINRYMEQYEVLRLMYRYACRYAHEHKVDNKEHLLSRFETYFSKKKRKLDNKCRKKFDKTLLGIILENRPDLLEEEKTKDVN